MSMIDPTRHSINLCRRPCPMFSEEFEKASVIQRALSGRHVLVVDDSADLRLVTATLLRKVRAVVACAENGSIALPMIEVFRPDLILLDIEMPVMGGFETARRVRLSGFKGIIIAVTSYDISPAALGKCGFDGKVAKPFGAADLMAGVGLALAGSALVAMAPAQYTSGSCCSLSDGPVCRPETPLGQPASLVKAG